MMPVLCVLLVLVTLLTLVLNLCVLLVVLSMGEMLVLRHPAALCHMHSTPSCFVQIAVDRIPTHSTKHGQQIVAANPQGTMQHSTAQHTTTH